MNTIRILGVLAVFLTTIAVISAAEATAGEASASDAGPSINYRLAPNDLVTIKVFQEEDLTTAARLAADGTITIPLIGQVKLGGLTAHEASRQVARLLDARFLVNPQVSVTL